MLSDLLEKYAGGREFTHSIPLDENSVENWVFKTWEGGADWDAWESKLAELWKNHAPPTDESGQAHRIAEVQAGAIYADSIDALRHATLCHSQCVRVYRLNGDEVEEGKLYRLSEWIQLANKTLLVKEAFAKIDSETMTTRVAAISIVYDKAKKNSASQGIAENS